MEFVIYSAPTIALANGYTATRYHDGGNWIVYHKSRPRRAVWESWDARGAADWARENPPVLPQHAPTA